ncbi:MAG: DUF4255 domain-containing protein [Pseudomonadota bacterium]
MIDAAIEHLAARLNGELRTVFGMEEQVVVVSNILEQDGTNVPEVANKLAVFLVNLEKESAAQGRAPRVGGGGLAVLTAEPLHLNIYLMVAANYRGAAYTQGLRYLSAAASYFQRHPVFDRHNSPDLPAPLERLVLDIENLSLQDLGTLWGALSGHYTPSLLYKVRTVSYASDDIRARVPVARDPQTTASAGR